jgi:hypothetical protein
MTNAAIKTPIWLRLERAYDAATMASTVKSSFSMDGATWTMFDMADITGGEPIDAMIMITSGYPDRLNTAVFENITITGMTPAPVTDAGAPDGAGTGDAGTASPDAGAPADAASVDAAPIDAAPVDAAPIDAAESDAVSGG